VAACICSGNPLTLTIRIVGFDGSLQTSTLAPDAAEISVIFLPRFPITIPAEDALISYEHSLALALSEHLEPWDDLEVVLVFPEIEEKELRYDSSSAS
jgi:hypothetical protein